MLAEMIDKIVNLKETKIFEIDGQTYSDANLTRIPPHVDRPDSVSVSGLDAVCKLVRTEIAKVGTTIMVHVRDYNKVEVMTTYLPDFSRNVLYRAQADAPGMRTGWRDRETALIELRSLFIPNDTLLDSKENRVAIITGPNMAGKSTYMRQTALIVLMAQAGSFVPAAEAEIGIVDKIFTRVGASDDLSSGQSTFMVEMNEVAYILDNATEKSLVILDEIGRGTSTFDGLGIAWAVVEYIADVKKCGAKTMFATHYHELTELEGKLDSVNNYCIAVKEKGDDIVFLRKIVKGGADRSYGIQVAKLAGLPDSVIERAKEIAEQLLANDITDTVKSISVDNGHKHKKEHLDEVDMTQISLFDTVKDDDIIDELRSIDIGNMTPLDALNKLYQLQNKVKNRW